MQTKLTLAQLSGYLAYGLRIIYNSDNSEREMLLLDTTRDDYSHIFKPLVIPLDQLTEAQWIEVFKAGTSNQLGEIDINTNVIGINGDGFYLRYWVDMMNFEGLWTFNQLAAFAKLHELHADLHGLIEKGLAINKLDYENI